MLFSHCKRVATAVALTAALSASPTGPLSMSLRLDGTDHLGLALSQSKQLWYWQCATGCADSANWIWSRWDGLTGSVQDADLAFDLQNRPHLALRSSGAPFGWGLAHMTCMADCTTGAATWNGALVEDASRLGQDLSLPIPANCTTGTWMGDFRPSLALDPAGNLRVGFDNQFWVAGCTDSTQIRTEFEAVRVVYTSPATAAGQASIAGPGAAKPPISLDPRHGNGAHVPHHRSASRT